MNALMEDDNEAPQKGNDKCLDNLKIGQCFKTAYKGDGKPIYTYVKLNDNYYSFITPSSLHTASEILADEDFLDICDTPQDKSDVAWMDTM